MPSSYFGTCLSGFPNFFIMMGPNTLSGHLSVIYTTECQINFAMRIIRPILNTINTTASSLSIYRPTQDIVVVNPSAETRDIEEVQQKAKKLVWATGCTSWFIDQHTKRNTIMFPDWQFKFWIRSVFVSWNDFTYRTSILSKEVTKSKIANRFYFGAVIGGIAGLGALYIHSGGIYDCFEAAKQVGMCILG